VAGMEARAGGAGVVGGGAFAWAILTDKVGIAIL